MPHADFIAHAGAWTNLLARLRLLHQTASSRIFISYAWPSDSIERYRLQRWLTQLQSDLQALGFQVFLDLSDMSGRLREAMESNIRASQAALIIGTPLYANRAVDHKTNVAFEYQHLLEQAQAGKLTLFPLCYQGESVLDAFPAALKDYLIRDCRTPSEYVSQMFLLNPQGLFPALLKRRVGDEEYESAIAAYRVETLSHLPARNPDFTGREAALVQLAQGLTQRQQAAITHQQTIAGLGGVGKSQLANEYAHRHQKEYVICRWLASEGEVLQQSMEALAIDLGIDPKGLSVASLVGQVYQALNRYERWLLIFDNVDTPAALKPYLPQQAGAYQHILITSRSQGWRHQVGLSTFSLEEANAYVTQRLGERGSQANRQVLYEALGGLPLAYSQAVAYVEQTGVGIEDYVSLFKKAPQLAFSEIDQGSAYAQTVASTWQVAMTKLKENIPEALELLQGCAFLSPEEIPFAWLEPLMGDVVRFHQALKGLRAYSLVSTSDSQTLSVHRLVQLITREALSTESDPVLRARAALLILNRLQEACEACYPWHKQSARDIDLTRQLLAPLESLWGHSAALYDVLGKAGDPDWVAGNVAVYVNACLADAYGDLGDVVKQRDLLERALVIKEAHYGSDHYNVAITLCNLGTAYGDLGDVVKKRDLLERALVIQEAHYGSDHYEVAITLTNLGNAYGALGDVVKKRDLLERALVIKEAHYGSDHYEVAITLTCLGNAYGALGDVVKKRDLLERALVIHEAHYGSDHYNVAITLGNLGTAYGALGDVVKQRDLLERALVIQEAHYGSDHYVVAATLTNLGTAYGDLGDVVKQRDLLERALAIEEAHYGSDHYQVAITLFNLADAREKLGAERQATEDFARVYRVFNGHYGTDHQYTKMAHQRWQAGLTARQESRPELLGNNTAAFFTPAAQSSVESSTQGNAELKPVRQKGYCVLM